MPSAAHQVFLENRKDVNRLFEIHKHVAGDGVGRKHKVEVLNRAIVVLITAAWEAYVEDLAKESFDFLLARAVTATQFPMKVRTLAAEELAADPNRRRLWELADSGWKAVLTAHRAKILEKWVASFNTPRQRKVDDLFAELVGLTSLHSCWSWHGMGARDASRKLDAFITMRGAIAHRVRFETPVYKTTAQDYLRHVQRIVEKTDERVGAFLAGQVDTAPW